MSERTKGKASLTFRAFESPRFFVGTTRVATLARSYNLSDEETEANAEYLVLCWNSNSVLLDACKALLLAFSSPGYAKNKTDQQIIDKAKAAIALAKD